jgi:hypothetical protein
VQLVEPTDLVGIGTGNPVNKLDVSGNMAIGAGFAGTQTAPANGLIVEGPVGVGTPTVANSAILELNAPDKGLRLPRADTTDINLNGPVEGLITYQPSDKFVYYHDGTQWRRVDPPSVARRTYLFTTGQSMAATTAFLGVTTGVGLCYFIVYDSRCTINSTVTANTRGLVGGTVAMNTQINGNNSTPIQATGGGSQPVSGLTTFVLTTTVANGGFIVGVRNLSNNTWGGVLSINATINYNDDGVVNGNAIDY